VLRVLLLYHDVHQDEHECCVTTSLSALLSSTGE
jgi:hypothetical protein